MQKFQIDPQKFESLTADKAFSDSDETEIESDDDDDIDYDQSRLLGNSKLLLEKIIQVKWTIFWMSLISTESHHHWSKIVNFRLRKQV